MMHDTAAFFDAVVEASGLTALIAPYTMSRLLIAAGASPQTLTAADLAQALPHIQKGLAVYLDDEQLAQAVANLRRLASA